MLFYCTWNSYRFLECALHSFFHNVFLCLVSSLANLANLAKDANTSQMFGLSEPTSEFWEDIITICHLRWAWRVANSSRSAQPDCHVPPPPPGGHHHRSLGSPCLTAHAWGAGRRAQSQSAQSGALVSVGPSREPGRRYYIAELPAALDSSRGNWTGDIEARLADAATDIPRRAAEIVSVERAALWAVPTRRRNKLYARRPPAKS